MSEKHKVDSEFRKFLLLDDMLGHHPESEPYVPIAQSIVEHRVFNHISGELNQFVGIRALLVPVKQKSLAISRFDYGSFSSAGKSYFDNKGRYNPGEKFEYEDVRFEIITNDRFFEGLALSYYEPTDRLVNYLNLHRDGNRWIDPYFKDVIIKTGETTKGWEPHDAYLSIRKSELVDYLAARKCGLILLKYSERVLKTLIELTGLPEQFIQKPTKYGKQSWIVGKDPLDHVRFLYISRLWESFWIEPASRPRRWDAKAPEAPKDKVSFILSDGESATYDDSKMDAYFKLLSFKPTIIKNHLSMPNNRIEFSCLSNLNLVCSDASILPGCINQEGQFQAFFGLVAKLDSKKQRQLAAFSEPQKARPSYEYVRTNINAQFPETMPFNWILSNCLASVNSPWQAKFGETLLLSPAEKQLHPLIRVGPASDDLDELADIMLEFRKAIIPESKIENIKKQLNYSAFASDAKAYGEMRSIGFTRLLFCANRTDEKEGESYVLRVINALRNSKGHPKDVETVLKKFNIPSTSPRISFLYIMAEFCSFLSAFTILTASTLDVDIEDPSRGSFTAFSQLRVAEQYFRTPF